jgi:peptide/nickel transport system ATP-binding protein
VNSLLLEIADLHVSFDTAAGPVAALRGATLALRDGETLGVVGESGSGKTTAAMAAIGLLPPEARVTAGRIGFAGRDITHASRAARRTLRGGGMAMVFQNPRAALNPVRRIGAQMIDVIRAHRNMSRRAARARALELLDAVQFRDPARQIDAYAHELSGGLCQRAMIAMAIACAPRLLIADEPTTGLDAATQLAVMRLLKRLVAEHGMAMLLITHDLGLAATSCDRITVMRDGSAVETAPSRVLFASPQHAYTRHLVAATPLRGSTLEDIVAATDGTALPPPPRVAARRDILEVRGLSKRFGPITAVDDVSFRLAAGESLGLVGESGSGKSTISRMLCRLLDPSEGRILFEGQSIGDIPARRFHASPLRPRIQLVFQDPTDSLYPRFTAFDAIADPLRRLTRMRGAALHGRVVEVAALAGLEPALLGRRPHQLSGGQKARVGIARAIALAPALLVLDEPTAALDVSVQALILTTLERLKRELGMSYVFVSHDLNVVRMMCDRAIVLRAGRVVEEADSRTIFTNPRQDYTRQLLEAVPHIEAGARAPDIARQDA